jgi:hypothetical protein
MQWGVYPKLNSQCWRFLLKDSENCWKLHSKLLELFGELINDDSVLFALR